MLQFVVVAARSAVAGSDDVPVGGWGIPWDFSAPTREEIWVWLARVLAKMPILPSTRAVVCGKLGVPVSLSSVVDCSSWP